MASCRLAPKRQAAALEPHEIHGRPEEPPGPENLGINVYCSHCSKSHWNAGGVAYKAPPPRSSNQSWKAQQRTKHKYQPLYLCIKAASSSFGATKPPSNPPQPPSSSNGKNPLVMIRRDGGANAARSTPWAEAWLGSGCTRR